MGHGRFWLGILWFLGVISINAYIYAYHELKAKNRGWRMQGVSPFLLPFGDCIQLSILPVPRRATSMELLGLAPVRLLVSSTIGKSLSFNIIVQPLYRSFLLH